MIEKLQEIFREVFDDVDIKINMEFSSEDLDEWDSFNHVKLILSCEESFDIKFDIQEVAELNNIKSLVDAIKNKIS